MTSLYCQNSAQILWFICIINSSRIKRFHKIASGSQKLFQLLSHMSARCGNLTSLVDVSQLSTNILQVNNLLTKPHTLLI